MQQIYKNPSAIAFYLQLRTIASWGARERAAHGLNRPTLQRLATFPRTLSRESNGEHALNWQPGAAALLQGPHKTSNAKRRTQRLAHETGARQNEWSRPRRTLVLQRMGAEAQSEASGCPISVSGYCPEALAVETKEAA